MDITAKLNYVLSDHVFDLLEGEPQVYTHTVEEVEGEMRAFKVLGALGKVDRTTVFETAHPNLLAQIYNVTYDIVDAPLSSEEQTRLSNQICGAAVWPTEFVTKNTTQIKADLDQYEGLIWEWVFKHMVDELGAACPQFLLTWKAKVELCGMDGVLKNEIDPD